MPPVEPEMPKQVAADLAVDVLASLAPPQVFFRVTGWGDSSQSALKIEKLHLRPQAAGHWHDGITGFAGDLEHHGFAPTPSGAVLLARQRAEKMAACCNRLLQAIADEGGDEAAGAIIQRGFL